MKKILITGANSYIGTSFEKYMSQFGEKYKIDTIDMIGDSWKSKSFRGYDSVYHVAGIAHSDNGKISKEKARLYYEVNTKLTVQTALKAKKSGVKQFIFMSSAIVYGDSAPIGKIKMITKDTPVSPANCYGDSKVKAEIGLHKLEDENFKVVILRPPMIYGKESKGNYPLMSKISQKLPVFPYVKNCRSMLYVDNLMEFVRLMIENEESGTFFPQNKEYSNTSEMVRMIAEIHGNNVRLIHGFERPLKLLGAFTSIVDKAFGNLAYNQEISEYKENYHILNFKKTIMLTEKEQLISKKKVLFLVNHEIVIYNFRLEIVEQLLKEGYEVHISSPNGEKIELLKKIGAICHEIDMERHGMNPINELKLLRTYRKLLKDVNPDVVLGFTIKPNIYGAIAAKSVNTPYIANITGLGTAIENGGWRKRLFVVLYKYAFNDVQTVFFQNTENRNFFKENKIALGKHKMLPGSGVNINHFNFELYPDKDSKVILTYIGRIMKDKGIDEFLKAAQIIKRKYPEIIFRIIGFFDDDYSEIIKWMAFKGIIEYIEQQSDVRPYIKESWAIIQPSHHEGMSNVLLESCSVGRPVIASNIPGCTETFDNNISGIEFDVGDYKSLTNAIEVFLKLPYDQKVSMGIESRKKMEMQFNRSIVVNKYQKEIERVVR